MNTIKKILVLLMGLFFSITLFADECKIKVTVRPPVDDGGAPITGYYIEQMNTTIGKWVKVSNWAFKPYPTSVYTIVGDFQRVRYGFRVIAVNKYGESEPSEPDYADLDKDTYWEVYLFCKNGAAKTRVKQSSTTPFKIPNIFDSNTQSTVQVPFRLEE